MRKSLGKRIAGIAMALAVFGCVFTGTDVLTYAYTQTTGTVTSDNVKVRASASTTASQVSSLKNGDNVDIVDEATDSSGYVWYKIYINKNEFGYVRSDLVSKAGGSSTTTSTSTTSTASLPETSVTSTEQRTATVIADSVNVRKGAGTAYDSVGKVKKGESVTITGEASGTDGKNWYQVTFGTNSTSGFIRSDLVEISETQVAETTENTENVEGTEGTEGEYTEEQSEETSESSNVDSSTGDGTYSLLYTNDDEGNGVWYLYDNVGGYRVKVNELIEAAQSADAVNTLRKTNSNYKKILIALGVLTAVLVAGIIILALKLRDSLYYEDEEEEEYDRYSEQNGRRITREDSRNARNSDDDRPLRRTTETVRPSRRTEETERTERPVRTARRSDEEEEVVRPSRRKTEEERTVRPSRRTEEDEYVSNRRASRRTTTATIEEETIKEATPKRKARNFIGDDDDFEFEFLDLDDDK